jgi:hypothetical protein
MKLGTGIHHVNEISKPTYMEDAPFGVLQHPIFAPHRLEPCDLELTALPGNTNVNAVRIRSVTALLWENFKFQNDPLGQPKLVWPLHVLYLPLGRFTLARADPYAHGVGGAGESDLLHLFLSMPPATAAIFLSLWRQVNVLVRSYPIDFARHAKPSYLAAIHRQSRNGLQGCLVRSHGLCLHQHPIGRAPVVDDSQTSATSLNFGIHPACTPDDDRWRDAPAQRPIRAWPGVSVYQRLVSKLDWQFVSFNFLFRKCVGVL